MFNLIHPALAKAHALENASRPRPHEHRSTKRLSLRRAERRAARATRAARPIAAKPTAR
jgi:hypothetical protein